MKKEPIFFAEEKKNGVGRGGKYTFCRGEKKNSEGKGGKYLAKENVTIAGQTNK